MRDFWGTLCSSIKQIKAPYLCDWKQGILPHAMQGNRASSRSEGEVSSFFSSCGRNVGYILEFQRGWPFETPLCSAKSGLLSSYDGHLRNLNQPWKDNSDTSAGEVRDHTPLSSSQKDLGIPINFQEESGLVTFESLNSTNLSKCQEM